jgi:hypothetical protein
MSLLTKYGTLWGDVPQTTGDVWWVSPADSYTVGGNTYAASNGNDGLSPDRALRTPAQAISNARADNGDVVMMLPGTHTSASQVALSKAGLTFVGAHPVTRIAPQLRTYALNTKVNWTSTFAGTAVANTAADCAFVGINMIPLTARTFMSMIATPRNAFIGCAVTMSATASTSTKGIVFSGAAGANCSFVDCVFLNNVATSAQGPCLDLTAADNFLVEGCEVLLKGTSSAWAVAIQLGAASAGIFRRNFIGAVNAGTITIGIDGTGVAVANAVNLIDNRYGVSPGAGATKNFDNTDVSLVNNYYGTIGAGAGFVIHTIAV